MTFSGERVLLRLTATLVSVAALLLAVACTSPATSVPPAPTAAIVDPTAVPVTPTPVPPPPTAVPTAIVEPTPVPAPPTPGADPDTAVSHPNPGPASDGNMDDTVASSDPVPPSESPRPVPADMDQVPAPIESVEIHIAESYPPQYFAEVVSGLPNACVEFHSYEESRSGNEIRIAVYNLRPKPSQQIACAEIFQTHRVNIPLGTDFQSGETYTLKVNETTETFTAQ